MPLIIDAYNVLHTGGVLPPDLASFNDVEGLVRLLGISRYRGDRIELVCDGSPQRPQRMGGPGSGVVARRDEPQMQEPPAPFPGAAAAGPVNINVCYSGPGREADEVIAMLVRHSTAPRNLTVVSSDAAVLRTARRRRCRTLTSQQFLQQLATDFAAAGMTSPASAPKPPGGLSEAQVEAWLSVFEVDERAAECSQERKRRPEGAGAKDATATSGNDQQRQNPRPVLPQEIIDEAERMLRRHQREQ